MAFFNKYPYTDFSELNLDWVIEKINQLDVDIQGIEERATAEAVRQSKAYVDVQLQQVRGEFNTLTATVNALSQQFTATVDDIQTQYYNFVQLVNSELAEMNNRIEAIRDTISEAIIGVNARTDKAIADNNEYIFSVIQENLPTELKVRNFFTGGMVSIQDMFNYLSEFHAVNSATITEMVDADKTVTYLVGLNHSMSDWALNGKTYIS